MPRELTFVSLLLTAIRNWYRIPDTVETVRNERQDCDMRKRIYDTRLPFGDISFFLFSLDCCFVYQGHSMKSIGLIWQVNNITTSFYYIRKSFRNIFLKTLSNRNCKRKNKINILIMEFQCIYLFMKLIKSTLCTLTLIY